MARTLPFQGGEAGSKPVRATSFHGELSSWELSRFAKPVERRNRFADRDRSSPPAKGINYEEDFCTSRRRSTSLTSCLH